MSTVFGAGGRFTVHRDGCEDTQMDNKDLAAYLDEQLRMLLAYAQSYTPVNTGAWHLAESLEMVRSLPDPARRTQSGTVYSTSQLWNLIEWGSIRNPPYRPLSSAAVALGLSFHETDEQQ
jgi:hypothetical protein